MHELTAALGSAKTALGFLKAVVDTNNQARINAAISDVTDRFMTAQQAVLETLQSNLSLTQSLGEAQQTISKLEREIEQIKAQAQKLERYERYPVSKGVLVYRLKQVYAASERAHYACPHCMGRGNVSSLQTTMRYSNLECVPCKAVFPVYGSAPLDAADSYVASE